MATSRSRRPCSGPRSDGADDGIRTRDPHLGKVFRAPRRPAATRESPGQGVRPVTSGIAKSGPSHTVRGTDVGRNAGGESPRAPSRGAHAGAFDGQPLAPPTPDTTRSRARSFGSEDPASRQRPPTTGSRRSRDRRELDLDPDSVALSPGHASAKRGHVVITDGDPVASVRIEGGVGRSRPLRDPALDDEVSPNLVRVVAQVEPPPTCHDRDPIEALGTERGLVQPLRAARPWGSLPDGGLYAAETPRRARARSTA